MTADTRRRSLPVVAPTRLCPSSQPDGDAAVVLGVVDHSVAPPEVQYVDQALPVTDELLALAAPLRPTEVFRFAAPCQEQRCSHWNGRDCTLVERIVELIPAATLALPRCRVRGECRWYHQAGGDACRRCPRVVTQNQEPSDAMRLAASPAPDDS